MQPGHSLKLAFVQKIIAIDKNEHLQYKKLYEAYLIMEQKYYFIWEIQENIKVEVKSFYLFGYILINLQMRYS